MAGLSQLQPDSEMENANILEVRELVKEFKILKKSLFRKRFDTFRAVDAVSFQVRRGKIMGIVGESGSGKTTVVRMIVRALAPTSGSILFKSGRLGEVEMTQMEKPDLKLLRREIQMIFQDPYSSLNPRMTIEDILTEPMFIHKIGTYEKRRTTAIELLRRVGLDERCLARYPHAFSGGQRQRISIARALVLNPTLVIADEAVSALEVSIQAQVINLLLELQDSLNLTMVFVAHDLSVVRHVCNDVVVMHEGKVVESGPVESIFENPRHPYTESLLSAIPNPDPDAPWAPKPYSSDTEIIGM